MGIYIVDPERRIRFWNHGAEHITGHLAQEVVGLLLQDVVQACDEHGQRLSGDQRPVSTTISEHEPQQCTAFYLHKAGHRIAVRIRTRPILEYGDTIGGVSVLFEEALAEHDPPMRAMYGCLDSRLGIASLRLTRAVIHECMAGMEESRIGFGLLRIRLLGLEDFRAKHGPQSVMPFLRATAHTLRRSLGEENFLGCWVENEFLAMLPSASPVTVATTAETLFNLLSHSEVLWWGDRFLVESEVACVVATPGIDLDSLLLGMKPLHSSAVGKSKAAGSTNNSLRSRG
jgi:PAS domain S-box-containing protein